MATDDRSNATRCPVCGHHAAVVQVHGHGQCSRCGVNIDPCCSGDTACELNPSPTPPAANESDRLDAASTHLLQITAAGRRRSDLLNEFASRTGVDLDAAEQALAAAIRAGRLTLGPNDIVLPGL